MFYDDPLNLYQTFSAPAANIRKQFVNFPTLLNIAYEWGCIDSVLAFFLILTFTKLSHKKTKQKTCF